MMLEVRNRVEAELAEVKTRADKLKQFLESVGIVHVTRAQLDLMKLQLSVMDMYCELLHQRLRLGFELKSEPTL